MDAVVQIIHLFLSLLLQLLELFVGFMIQALNLVLDFARAVVGQLN
jgi:hypothetical protein